MNIFEEVKSAIDVKTAAERYGLAIRNDMTCCIFHGEKTASMKLYHDHFHCYGCSEHGDVIKLTGQLFNLSPIDSAKKLACDFGIAIHDDYCHSAGYTHHETHHKAEQPVISPVELDKLAYRLLNDYCNYLKWCRKAYAPKSMEETPHPLFVQALHEYEMYRYSQSIFAECSLDERIEFISEHMDMFGRIATCLSERKTLPAA